jgi:TetR/AcrR family transcriptional regulator, mexJK operon transcriptional repressor
MTSPDPICRLDIRRQAIVSAARELFIRRGYEQTTLRDVVDIAGGSLATVYKLFGNKDGLLEAVVLENVATSEALFQAAGKDGALPGPTLHRLSEELSTLFLNPEVVALVRIVMAQSIRDPYFARRFFERTATSTRIALEKLFQNWQERGIAMDGAPNFLAEMFMNPFVADLHTEAISHGAGSDKTPQRLRDRTEFFLKASGIGTGA